MTDLNKLGQNASAVKSLLQTLSTEVKNKALCLAADCLVKEAEYLIAENRKDMETAEQNGMSSGLLDRLKLTKERIEAMAEGLRQIAELPDCIGEVMEAFERPNGMKIRKGRVPIGVLGIR